MPVWGLTLWHKPPMRWSRRLIRTKLSGGVFTLFNAGSPSVFADIDRLKAEKVGLTPTDVFSTMQLYLGSQYVNDFNYLGRTYRGARPGETKSSVGRRKTSRA